MAGMPKKREKNGNDFYICVINLTGTNIENRSSRKYPDLQSARRAVPLFGELPDISEEDSSGVEENEKEVILDDDAPHPFSQIELNDLVRDLRLSKSSAELLASRLTEKNSLSNSARINFYRNRHKENLRFSYADKDLVLCTDIAPLLH